MSSSKRQGRTMKRSGVETFAKRKRVVTPGRSQQDAKTTRRNFLSWVGH